MANRTTFHLHEIVGANMAYDLLNRLGFEQEEISQVVKLVRWHQFRFYPDTTDNTLIQWLQTLGKGNFNKIITVNLSDRAGNDLKEEKPLLTKETNSLITRCLALEGKFVYFEDLSVNKEDLFNLGIPKKKHKEIFMNMAHLVQQNPKHNNRSYLISYLKKNFAGKNNDRK